MPLVAIYPKEGTLYSDSPYVILDAPWATADKRAGAQDFLIKGGATGDVLERAIYNGVLAGVSLDGEKFNYTNPLALIFWY